MHYNVAYDFSQAARRYNSYASLQQDVVERAAALLEPLLGADAQVLDVGCGTGRLAEYIHQPIVGCDLATGMCAQTSFPSVCADGALLPFADNCVDAVFSSLAIQWMEEKPLALAEMQRVCHEGGVAVVTTLGPNTLCELRDQDIPTLEFMDEATYRIFAEQAGWVVEASSTEVLHREYASLLELLRNIKAIGARHKTRRGYLRKSELMQPAQATWEVITLQLRKVA